jgi:carboxymethylenebutenolidase
VNAATLASSGRWVDLDKLTPEQRAMVDLWEAHLKAEFQDKDARASCDTMVARPYVNHVPVL